MKKNQFLGAKSTYSPESDPAVEPAREPFTAPEKPSDHSLARSVAWNAVGDWGTQVFTWLAFLVVVRLLTPADFGIVALAGVLMPYLAQVNGLGLPRAVVVLRNLTDDQLAQMNTVCLLSGAAVFLLGAAIAKPFAAFFKIPAFAPVFIVFCGGLISGAVGGVPGALLAKDMRFRFLSILAAGYAMMAAIATLVMAWLGFGYWALILGNLLAGAVRTVVVVRVRPCRWAWPRLNSIREPLGFGWRISVSMLALNSYQRLDNFVAGRVLGPTALGFYGTAWSLANVPIEKVTSLVTTVIPSYLAAVQDQPEAIRRYLRILTEMIALATFPATIGLSLVSPELVPVAFGHKWDGMVGPLEVLSFYAAFRSIVALLPKILTAVGNVHYVMWNDLAALLLLPVAFYIGSYRGTTGIAWAWVIAYPFIVLPIYWKTFQTIGMGIGEYLRALRPALSGTIAMIPAVEWARYSLAPTRPLMLRLVVEVAVGAFAYLGILRLFHRDRVMVLIQQARAVLRRKKSPLQGGPTA
jgi:PST family polysaccharide transporter